MNTVLTGIEGILFLIALVALITFGEDINKWLRRKRFKMRKRKRIQLAFTQRSKQMDYLFLDKKETLFMQNESEQNMLTHSALKEKNRVLKA